jgi:hypothetical protein
VTAVTCLVVLAVAAVRVGSGVATIHDPPRIAEWDQVGDIALGMPRAQVEAEYGRKPAHLVLVTYRLQNGSIDVAYDAGHVEMITLSESHYYRARDGFRIGYRIPVGLFRRGAGAVCQPVLCVKLRLSRIRLSKTDRRWAAANYAAPGRQSGYAVLHREGARWRVVDYGTADVGCSSAPTRVLHDLGIYCGH